MVTHCPVPDIDFDGHSDGQPVALQLTAHSQQGGEG